VSRSWEPFLRVLEKAKRISGYIGSHRPSRKQQRPGREALAAWHRVYEGLSDEDQAAVEVIALDRSRFSRNQPE